MSQKKQNKLIRKKYALLKEINENPDWCYCEELLGLEPDIDETKPIGITEPINGFPHPESKDYTQNIFICKRCEKKATISCAY